MKKTIKFSLTLILALSLFSCKKNQNNDVDNYVTSGTALIKNYDLTISPWQWSYDNLYDRHYYRFYNSSYSSQDLVYGYIMSGSGKQAIPYYTCVESNAWCEQFDLANTLFSGYIELQYTNYVNRTTAPSSDKYFYIVIVPSTIKTANSHVDWTNYDEVKRTFNLGEPIHLHTELKN